MAASTLSHCSTKVFLNVSERPQIYTPSDKAYRRGVQEAFASSLGKIAGLIGQIPKYFKYFGHAWGDSLSLKLCNTCAVFAKSGLPVRFLIDNAFLLLNPDSLLYENFGTKWLGAVSEAVRDLTDLVALQMVVPQLQVINIISDLFFLVLSFYHSWHVLQKKTERYPDANKLLPHVNYIPDKTFRRESHAIAIVRIAKTSFALLSLGLKCLVLYDPFFAVPFALLRMVLATIIKVMAIFQNFLTHTSSRNCLQRQAIEEFIDSPAVKK